MRLVSVTQKGQVTLPKKAREKVGISVNDKVRVDVVGGAIKIRPVKHSILDLAGFIPARKGKNALQAREQMAKEYKLR